MKRLCAIILLFCSLTSFSQKDSTLITVSFNNVPARDLINSVEKQTGYTFFYVESWLDTVNVSVELTTSITPVLRTAFRGKGIEFFILDQRVILTPGIRIIDILSAVPDDEQPLLFLKERSSRDPSSISRKIIQIGSRSGKGSNALLRGYIKEKKSGEPLAGVLLHTASSSIATSSDAFGFYSITLPKGRHSLRLSLMGMTDVAQEIDLTGDGSLDFAMEESAVVLKEVVVSSDREMNVSGVHMGITKVDVRAMKNIPKVLGENDVMKVALTMPGVKSAGEGGSGIYVRGGNADQNLILLNEASIYNTSHFLGFFSIFNADAIRSFELYKSGIPVQFGGRLSSTIEMLLRDGNQKKFSGQGGIGPITSHLMLEVPLVKDRTSLMVGGRTTYSNWILNNIPSDVLKDTKVSFYDGTLRLTHHVNKKNTVYLSLYGSHDEFNLSTDTLFSYSNKLASLQWRKIFTPELSSLLSVTRSEYEYDVDYHTDPERAFNVGFGIKESNVKWAFSWDKGKHSVEAGAQSKLYELDPGFIHKGSPESITKERQVQNEKGLETALFVADQLEITPDLSVYAGIRYSMFSALGSRTIRNYESGGVKSDITLVDSTVYSGNEVIKTFSKPELRFNVRYKLTSEASLKASYNTTMQSVHMLSNTVSVSPTDTWKLSDSNIRPQEADQVSLGFYKDLRSRTIELSVELYYKWIRNILDYKTGADLLVNERIEQQVIQGKGKAYGVELLLKKNNGKFTGWLAYSYARTFIMLKSQWPEEQVNRGAYFPANYDKPHDVNIVTNYKITRRYSFSINGNYSTGRPATFPISAYRFGNTFRVNYSDRNAHRIPDYFRLDIGFNIEGNHKIKKLAHSFWTISIYNVLGRKNPYSVYFSVEGDDVKAYQLSVFGAPVPSVTYHFKF